MVESVVCSDIREQCMVRVRHRRMMHGHGTWWKGSEMGVPDKHPVSQQSVHRCVWLWCAWWHQMDSQQDGEPSLEWQEAWILSLLELGWDNVGAVGFVWGAWSPWQVSHTYGCEGMVAATQEGSCTSRLILDMLSGNPLVWWPVAWGRKSLSLNWTSKYSN